MRRYIEKFDQFGALFQMKIINHDHEFRSLYGGIVSLLIYVTITAYTCYQIALWSTKAIPPTVVSKINYVPDGFYLNLKSRLFTFSIENCLASDQLHALEEKGRLFTVDGTYYGMNNVVHPLMMNPEKYNCGLKKEEIDFFSPLCFNPAEDEQTWMFQDATRLNDVYFEYYVKFCDPKIDPQCLKLEDAVKFLTEDTYWRLTIFTQDVNLQTGEIFEIPKDYYFVMKDERPVSIQLKVTKAILLIDDGFILPNEHEVEIIQDVKLQISLDPPSQNAGPHIQISMEKYYVSLQIQFVKIPGIIADISSLLQTLLLVGYLLSKVNSEMLQNKMKDTLLKLYFPQCCAYEIVYDWRNKLKCINHNGSPMEQEQAKTFIDFRIRMLKAIDMQFNQIHIISQINKIQLALQLVIPREVIQHLRDVDYVMKSDRSLGQLENQDESKEVFDEEDFMMVQMLSEADYQVHPRIEDLSHSYQYSSDNPQVRVNEIPVVRIIDGEGNITSKGQCTQMMTRMMSRVDIRPDEETE